VSKKPLVSRVYKYKNKSSTFFCPLCRTERGITTSPRLTKKNLVQILLTSIVLGSALYPVWGVKCFFVFFVAWAVFELAVRTDYKKQITCPHCGFDATWYKRDVKVARQLVKDFWLQKQGLADEKTQPVTKAP
jgi:transcription elongation factor Elf1